MFSFYNSGSTILLKGTKSSPIILLESHTRKF